MAKSSMATPPAGADQRRPLAGAGSSHLGEKSIKFLLALCAAFSIIVTTGIVVALVVPTVSFFGEITFSEFLFGTVWQPAFANPSFGVLPIVVGTLIVVVTALLVAIPIGLASAVYLSEYASPRVRKTIKPVLEVLEGIPTVAIGLFAFFFMRPIAESLFPFFPWETPFSIGIAGMAVGLLIVPLVASVSEDAMRSVPGGLREGAYALGSSKMRVTLRVVFPAAISGIIAGIVLGTSRAIGETMVVLIAAGAGNPNLTFDWFNSAQTMTAYIGGTATGDIPQGTIVYDTIFAVGTLLFSMTLVMNIIATRLVRRFREVYE
ncbi:phosphate ABC transporter permease subunit PstC [Nocardiopsis sp. EMB25]|uniref:phosphate ABC transporter permease subunit PstC n=2 Tax=Nocardiopsis TaxID=2013 RepID=UPI000478176F|nr:phosphate ABC transporter permease subunit PstC [Nocardiopsis sp. EMB25]MCY9786396.1 phosphate ABC transporter permease subunit PstC [Nocardiopsis sp. EMB25]